VVRVGWLRAFKRCIGKIQLPDGAYLVQRMRVDHGLDLRLGAPKIEKTALSHYARKVRA
jgi:hypothetical protein